MVSTLQSCPLFEHQLQLEPHLATLGNMFVILTDTLSLWDAVEKHFVSCNNIMTLFIGDRRRGYQQPSYDAHDFNL